MSETYSNPFSGEKQLGSGTSPGEVGGNIRGWLSGEHALADINRGFEPVRTKWSPYDPDTAAAQIGTTGQQWGTEGAAQFAGRGAAQADVASGQVAAGTTAWEQDRQRQLAEAMRARASGEVPSAAEMQLGRAREQNIRAMMAASASQRGMNPAAQQRMLSQGMAQENLAVSGIAAELRAREQAQAEQSYAGMLSGMRGQQFGEASFGAQQAQQVGLANLQAQQQQQAMNDQMVQFYIGQGMSRDQAEMEARMELERIKSEQAKAEAQVATAEAEREQEAKGGAMKSGGALLGALSDRRAKKNIKRSDEDMKELMGAIKSQKYLYKDEVHGEGEQFGLMAQDLEKSKAGRSLVAKRPDGLKEVKVPQAALAALAAAAVNDKRLRALEQNRA